MGCKTCGAVAIPQSDPAICPECFIRESRRPALVLGIHDTPLTFEQLNAAWPEQVTRAEFDSRRFNFHVTDMGHLTMVDNASGMPLVWFDGYDHMDADSRWVSWSEYIRLMSEG